MTLSVGHFKGRYEAWNWKYQIEDTITMTMELELQVDEASVNSQHNLGLGKQSNRELLFSLLLFSNNVICEATKLPLLFFLTNPSPLNFLLSRLNTPHPFNNQQYFQIQHCHLCLCSFFKLAVLFFSFGIWMQQSTDYIFVCCSSLLSYFGQIICHIIKRWDQTSMCNFLFVLNSWPRPINWWEIKNTWKNISNTLFDTLFLTHMSD